MPKRGGKGFGLTTADLREQPPIPPTILVSKIATNL